MTQEPKDRKSDPIQVKFSLPQLMGGALAAATAAVIGSRLGVAGTIFGAAVASMIGGVAGTLYSAGLDRTHRRVTEAIRRGYARVLEGDEEATQVLPMMDETAPMPPIDPAAAEAATEATLVDLQPVPAAPDGGRRRKVLVAMGISVAAIFVVAMLAITAIELGLGRSLDGSATTTVGGARRPTPAATVSQKPTPSPGLTSTAPATTAPATGSAEPTQTASEVPSSTPSTSAAEVTTPFPGVTAS